MLAAIRICPLAATKMAMAVITESERVACSAAVSLLPSDALMFVKGACGIFLVSFLGF